MGKQAAPSPLLLSKEQGTSLSAPLHFLMGEGLGLKCHKLGRSCGPCWGRKLGDRSWRPTKVPATPLCPVPGCWHQGEFSGCCGQHSLDWGETGAASQGLCSKRRQSGWGDVLWERRQVLSLLHVLCPQRGGKRSDGGACAEGLQAEPGASLHPRLTPSPSLRRFSPGRSPALFCSSCSSPC